MAWLARDKDNTLVIYEGKPRRREDVGCFAISTFEDPDDSVELPSNADKKLIGRHITWDDEPVELKVK